MNVLRARARILESTRRFFAGRDVLEVDTPYLSAGVIVERHLDPLCCTFHAERPGETTSGRASRRLYLQTSPESAMKQLLAAGSGPIFQITRTFRNGEYGRLHRPEFTMLEWYRPGFDHLALMDEVAELITAILGPTDFERVTHRELLRRELGVDPLTATVAELGEAARQHGHPSLPPGVAAERDTWLEFLLGCLQPGLGHERALFVHDFPPTQAALARIRRDGDVPVAERFELFIRGVELCNGYHELREADEHLRRLEEANRQRLADGKAALPLDRGFLDAIRCGLPACAGVALGFDRLVLLALDATSLDDVLPFPFAGSEE